MRDRGLIGSALVVLLVLCTPGSAFAGEPCSKADLVDRLRAAHFRGIWQGSDLEPELLAEFSRATPEEGLHELADPDGEIQGADGAPSDAPLRKLRSAGSAPGIAFIHYEKGGRAPGQHVFIRCDDGQRRVAYSYLLGSEPPLAPLFEDLWSECLVSPPRESLEPGDRERCLQPRENAERGVGRICVSDVPRRRNYSIQVDDAPPVATSTARGVWLRKLSLGKRHAVRIRNADRVEASFWFDFEKLGQTSGCLWFKPRSRAWSLWPLRDAQRVCSCDGQSADGPAALHRASARYQQSGDAKSLEVIERVLRKGMTRLEVEALLGPPGYAPTVGQYYYGSDRSVPPFDGPGNDQVPQAAYTLVVEYRGDDVDQDDRLSDRLQSWFLGGVGE